MKIAEFDQFVLPTYARFSLEVARAEGSYFYDTDGKTYLDFLSGWGVSNLGHRHPALTQAVTQELGQLIHVPNVFYAHHQGQLAKLLVKNSFPSQVFFCNSGAEANEAAIKYARLYGAGERFEIITAEQSFHGRTAGAMAATGQDKVRHGFEPILEGFRQVPYNDVAALEQAIGDQTVAIMMELVQGEGGVRVATDDYVATIKELCKKHDLLFIADEVQTGMGRTGKLWGYQHYDITPDIMTAAKALGGGLPIGAAIVAPKVAKFVKPGMHGSTFGGGSAVAAGAIAVLEATLEPRIQSHAAKIAREFSDKLAQLADSVSAVREVRQRGLMIGITFDRPTAELAQKCLDNGLFVNSTQETVIRMLPPLTLSSQELNEGWSIFEATVRNWLT